MKRFISLCLSLAFGIGCATTGNINVLTRDGIDTSNSKIVVFPLLLWDGKQITSANSSYSNPLADGVIAKTWTSGVGKDNIVVVPRQAIDRIPRAYEAMNIIVHSFDAASSVERSGDLSGFIDTVTSQFGDGAMAIALVSADKASYEKSGSIRLNMGLFDMKRLSWRWITKNAYTKGMVPIPYEKIVQDLVDQSYDALMKKTGGKIR